MTSATTAFPIPYEERFAETLSHVQAAMERYLTEYQPDPVPGVQRLWEAMRYGTLDGGKRIRPVIAIESCLACGGDLAAILPTACAIELVHAQSLIHDDLPCMDNDDLRRGKPTLHRAFDEATAVLTGDALLALAFGLITRHTPTSGKVSPQTLLDVITDFSDVTSVRGLVNGQYVDIAYEGKPYTAEVLEYIHTYKTGALFSFCTRVGARLAGGSPQLVETFDLLGKKLGLAFQIVDDLLDIQSTTEALGKTPGKDQLQQKATFPAFYGEEQARQKARELIEEAIGLLSATPGVRADGLLTLARFIEVRIH